MKTTRFAKTNLLGFCAIFMGVVAFSCSTQALAQSNYELSNKVRRLENEIQTLSEAVFKGEYPVPRAAEGQQAANSSGNADLPANLELRVSQLEMELRSLTGQLEQNNFNIKKLEQLVEKRLADLEMRIADTEARVGVSSRDFAPSSVSRGNDVLMHADPSGDVSAQGGAARNAADLRVVETALDAPQMQQDPQGQQGGDQTGADRNAVNGGDVSAGTLPQNATANEYYDMAFSYLRQKDYENAAGYFQKLITEYPDHELASNAQYWLGETYYVRNDYERAARIFAEAYQKYPDGTKGPDNLLKLGMSLAGLKKKEDACIAFSQLKRQYESAAPSIISRANREMEILDCP